MTWIGVIGLHVVLRGVERAGGDVEALLRRTGLERGAFADPDGRIAAETAMELWAMAAEMVGDPDFGVHLAERAMPGDTEALGLALSACATVGEAWRRAATYFRLVSSGVEVELRIDGGHAHLRHDLVAVPSPPRAPIDFALAMLVRASACARACRDGARPRWPFGGATTAVPTRCAVFSASRHDSARPTMSSRSTRPS